MTITNQVRAVTYVGNDVTTIFPYTFIIPDEASVVVQLVEIATNVITVLNDTQYTITGINNPTGGQVTYPLMGSPLAPEFQIQIVRVTVPIQEVSVNNQSAYDAEVVEGVWDRLTMMNQDNFDDLNRALLAPIGGTGALLFPGAENTVPIYDADGNLVEGPTADQVAAAQGFAIAAAASAAAAAASLTDFETRYLGAYAVDPTVDNDGLPLIVGASYWNSTFNELRFYDGANWVQVIVGPLVLDNLGQIAVDPTNVVAGSALQMSIDGLIYFRMDNAGFINFGAGAPSRELSFDGAGAIRFPTGTTAQRPGTPLEGDVRRNSETGQFEGYSGSGWGGLGGAGLFKGDNGESGDTVNGAGDIFRVHEKELNTDTTIDGDENAVGVGPLTIASGVTLTVATGGVLVIV